jgi:hypothetical protein
MKRLLPVLILSSVAFAGLVGSVHGPLDRVGWLAGCWEMRAGDRLIEEQWMAPRGTLMTGMSRTTVAGATRTYEHTSIREEGNRLIYRASPAGQATAEFRSSELGDGAVVFSNPLHDFPQRIRYRRAAGGDSLYAAIEGTLNGQTRTVSFPYARVACAGGS